MRPWTVKWVKQGLWVVLGAQKIQHPLLSQLISFCSLCVSIEFYATFLPLLFWANYSYLARQLALLMAVCLYIGNALKDVVCAPRPPSPPVVRIRNNDNDKTNAQEYGLPSTHTINTLALLGYIVHYFVQEGQIEITSLWGAVGGVLLLGLFIMYGRLYQGMHSPVDMYVGAIIAAVALVLWCQVDRFVDSWVTGGTNVISFQIVLAVLFNCLYPVPETPTPSYDYHVSFNGVALGVIVGVHRTFAQFHNGLAAPLPIFTRPGAIAIAKRLLIGLPAILFAKEGSKAFLKATLPAVTRALGIPIRGCSALPVDKESPTRVAEFPSLPASPSNTSSLHKRQPWGQEADRGLGWPQTNGANSERKQTSEASWDSTAKLGQEKDSKHWVEDEGFNLDTTIRLISYASVAWTVTEGMPYVFQFLSL
ncbi:Long Chain Base 1-Phosphate Phosphatase [Klebsormidium nitens]|uniref:Long Chain Base 1-Phosphate Phosphatase n=1 Tax=Klebsormidium nitens TaxID=105231 RepID=A0A1Y1HWC6_KLENI|nr:Long Chain Base 1-Phosphate Phosphatase [Klebsormidium nitens]|eukprot:GAQ80827.1 Long Chain Base 1-Phosphate Phosphatase [Klebsormidium nitens]